MRADRSTDVSRRRLCRTVRRVTRPLRSDLPNGVFHAGARGVDDAVIFRDDQDRWSFLGLLAEIVRSYEWRPYAYCLMTNHYHLVVDASRAALSAGFKRLNGVHAQRFNVRHVRRGHLFGDRFWTRLVEGDTQLGTTCLYVLENPVRAGLCAKAADWPWSASRRRLRSQ